MALFGRTSPRQDQRAEAYADWLRRQNPLAIVACVLGVLSLIELGALIVFGVAGIVVGVLALAQLRDAHRRMETTDEHPDRYPPPTRTVGRRLAWTGILLSIASLAMAAFLYFAPARGWGAHP